jgi:small GTP-binding protein
MLEMSMNYSIGQQPKIVMIGEAGVGKSSMLYRYVYGKYDPNVTPTTGASFYVKKLTLDDVPLALNVWDTAGQERYKSICGMYYKDADACICVLDVSDPDTLVKTEAWILRYKQHNLKDDPMILLACNKCDLPPIQWNIFEADVKAYAKLRDYAIEFTSSITGEGLDKIFEQAARRILAYREQNPGSTIYNRTMKLQQPDPEVKTDSMCKC